MIFFSNFQLQIVKEFSLIQQFIQIQLHLDYLEQFKIIIYNFVHRIDHMFYL
jgi:hypothetical protein